MTYAPETDPLAVVLDLGTPYSVSTDPLTLDFDFLPAGEAQQLLANSLEANSSTKSSDISQIHTIASGNLVFGSSTANTAIAQTQSLSANRLESFATVTNASLVEEGPDAIISEYIESVSTTSETVLSQVHSLSAISLDSDSKLTEPTLMAKDYLLAYGVDSWSKVSIPALVQIQSLQSQIIVCNPVTSNGVLEQIHRLTSDSIESISTAGKIWRIDILANLNISKKINHTLYQSRKVSSTLNLD